MYSRATFARICLVCLFISLLIVIGTTAVFGAVINVPEDFGTIQAAIDAAVSGDMVIIDDGTYKGVGNKDLDYKGKAITVMSENGPENCIIDCEGDGRGVYFHTGETSSSILSGITITNGNADFGGGIRCSSSPIITNCRIIENTAQNSGGGIFFALWSCTVTNSVIAGNTAASGGAIYSSNAKPRLVNCTMIGNTGTGAVGISSSASDVVPTITNCILWEEPSIFYYSGFPYPVNISYCDLKSTEIEGATITHSDPLFTDVSGTFPLEWDLHLLSSSPCIDIGDNSASAIPTNDFEGDQRIIDGDNDGTATVDLGVDEYRDVTQTTVNGTLILPEEAVNKEYVVIVDNDTEGDNGWAAATVGTCGSGTAVDYSITNVPAGTYYVYAVVRIVSAHDSPAEDGDYFGFYGSGTAPPDKANAMVPDSGTVTFDITVSPGANVVTAKTLYDDFSATYLDSGKWIQGQLVREVSEGMLVLEVHNSVNEGVVRETVPFADPSSIHTIECDIVLNTAALDSGTDSESFARIDGRFYNAQNSGTERGDIWAGLYLGDRGNGIEAWWTVNEAMDNDGNIWEEKDSAPLNIPGLSYGQSYTLKIDYHDENEFTFTVAGVSTPFTGPVKQAAEYTKYKALEALVYTNAGSGDGYISARFDNVLTNGTAYDNFSAGPLDHSKWQRLESVRKIENGKLRLTSHSAGDRGNTYLNFSEISPYTEATVKIDSTSTIASGDRGIARIDGYFYNDTYGPGNYNGYEGNVWVAIYMNYYGDGTLNAACYAEKILDAANTQFEELFYRQFNLPIDLDKTYRLSIRFTGKKLLFTCKDMVSGREDIFSYEITKQAYEPFDKNLSLLSRVFGDTTGGYMVVDFDDVYVDIAEPAAVYDATGQWEVTSSNLWAASGCGLPDVNDTDTITITQAGNDLTLVVPDDAGDMTLTGMGYGKSYYFKSTEEEASQTEVFYGTFTLSQITKGSGSISMIWTEGNKVCEAGFDITMNKLSDDDDGDDSSDGDGNSNSCFIGTLIH
jgi:hypothetical protein